MRLEDIYYFEMEFKLVRIGRHCRQKLIEEKWKHSRKVDGKEGRDSDEEVKRYNASKIITMSTTTL